MGSDKRSFSISAVEWRKLQNEHICKIPVCEVAEVKIVRIVSWHGPRARHVPRDLWNVKHATQDGQ